MDQRSKRKGNSCNDDKNEYMKIFVWLMDVFVFLSNFWENQTLVR